MMRDDGFDVASILRDSDLNAEGVPAVWAKRAAEEVGRGGVAAAQRYLDAGRDVEERARLDDTWHGFDDLGFDN